MYTQILSCVKLFDYHVWESFVSYTCHIVVSKICMHAYVLPSDAILCPALARSYLASGLSIYLYTAILI